VEEVEVEIEELNIENREDEDDFIRDSEERHWGLCRRN